MRSVYRFRMRLQTTKSLLYRCSRNRGWHVRTQPPGISVSLRLKKRSPAILPQLSSAIVSNDKKSYVERRRGGRIVPCRSRHARARQNETYAKVRGEERPARVLSPGVAESVTRSGRGMGNLTLRAQSWIIGTPALLESIRVDRCSTRT